MEKEAFRNRRKQVIFVIAFMVMAFVLYTALHVLYNRKNTTVQVEKLDSFIVGNPSDLRYSVDFEGVNGTADYQIEGWAVKPGRVYSLYNYGMDKTLERVYNNLRVGYTDGTNVYIFPTKLVRRAEANDAINDGIDYGYCGFLSKIPVGNAEGTAGGDLILIWRNPDGTQELYYL